MNLPNKLTMLRVLLIPVFMVCAANRWMLAAGIIFAAASLTDCFDGHLARKKQFGDGFRQICPTPLADKLLTTTAFLYMLVDGVCDPVVLAIILAREFAVSGLRMVAAGAPGGKVIAANMWGKVKTVLQMVTIIYYYFAAALAGPADAMAVGLISQVLCWLVAAVTLISGVKYLWDNRRFINTAK